MLKLPEKNEVVSLWWIEEFCAENLLYDLRDKIKNDPPKKLFKSDGCSWWPDKWRSITGELVCIYRQCFIHDLKYWAGYSEKNNPIEQIARFMADAELVIGIVSATKRIDLGEMMFAGVRSGGHERWHLPFSWGFGRV